MSDLIDRRAAIDLVMKYGKKIPTYAIACKIGIEQLPPAEPQRMKGKWIVISDGYVDAVECDQCGKMVDDISNYCPNCGADMREERE